MEAYLRLKKEWKIITSFDSDVTALSIQKGDIITFQGVDYICLFRYFNFDKEIINIVVEQE